jgi:hypothetical protein
MAELKESLIKMYEDFDGIDLDFMGDEELADEEMEEARHAKSPEEREDDATILMSKKGLLRQKKADLDALNASINAQADMYRKGVYQNKPESPNRLADVRRAIHSMAAEYEDNLADIRDLEAAIDAFEADPSEENKKRLMSGRAGDYEKDLELIKQTADAMRDAEIDTGATQPEIVL